MQKRLTHTMTARARNVRIHTRMSGRPMHRRLLGTTVTVALLAVRIIAARSVVDPEPSGSP